MLVFFSLPHLCSEWPWIVPSFVTRALHGCKDYHSMNLLTCPCTKIQKCLRTLNSGPLPLLTHMPSWYNVEARINFIEMADIKTLFCFQSHRTLLVYFVEGETLCCAVDGIIMHILQLNHVMMCISHFANIIYCLLANLKLSVINDSYNDCLMSTHTSMHRNECWLFLRFLIFCHARFKLSFPTNSVA
jgi:hypothetical protein